MWRGTREGKRSKSRNINKANDIVIKMTKISLYHHWVVKSEHRKRRKFTMETSQHFEQIGVPYSLVCMSMSLLLLDQELSDTVSVESHMRSFYGSSQRRFQRNSFKLSRFHMPENRSLHNIALGLRQQ